MKRGVTQLYLAIFVFRIWATPGHDILVQLGCVFFPISPLRPEIEPSSYGIHSPYVGLVKESVLRLGRARQRFQLSEKLVGSVLGTRLITDAIHAYFFAEHPGANRLFHVSQPYFGPLVTAPRVNAHVPARFLREKKRIFSGPWSHVSGTMARWEIMRRVNGNVAGRPILAEDIPKREAPTTRASPPYEIHLGLRAKLPKVRPTKETRRRVAKSAGVLTSATNVGPPAIW
ncbi:hypothetical protein WN48_08334 [Eufriesea mexicana]|uniref:Uncharacterized protein n=1 Tax=Eufriesea mexicana TaxID=516756 RepID=A0A310SKA5_9HYME|nr:hypothetical protein WN48_08334 [Eufriesea mexicana]